MGIKTIALADLFPDFKHFRSKNQAIDILLQHMKGHGGNLFFSFAHHMATHGSKSYTKQLLQKGI